MVRPYSNDLQERVARLMIEGRSARATAQLFAVSVARMVKWSQRLRATGTAASRPMGGQRKRILASEQDSLLARLAECPDLTVRGLAIELKARGFAVSPNTVWSLLRSAAFSFQKDAVRRRAEAPRHRPPADAVAEGSGAA